MRNLLMIFIIIFFMVSLNSEAQLFRRNRAVIKTDLTVSFARTRFAHSGPIQVTQLSRVRVIVRNNGKITAKNFYVDVFLSKARTNYTSQRTKPYILLKHGRKHCSELGPGKKWEYSCYVKTNIPNKIIPGNYYLGVKVDAGNNVKETNEKNNTFYYYTQLTIKHIYITSVMQYCRGMGNYGIVIFGKGFGDTPGSKIVKNGLYKLESVYWTDTEVDAQLTPNQVNFWSNNYIYLYDPGIKKMISNKVPIVLVPVHLGGFYPNENAKPGTEIKLDGCFFGAIQGQRKLKFGNSIVPTTSWKDNLIIFTVPSLSPGRYDVYIEESNKRISNKRFFHIQ